MRLANAVAALNSQIIQNIFSGEAARPSCDYQNAVVRFDENWRILGPFQIGTRGTVDQSERVQAS